MAQQLIVEGKDAIVLSNILKKRRLNPPLGYKNKDKFIEEFVIETIGISKVTSVLKDALNKPEISNIGVIVDANDKGFESRRTLILNTVSNVLEIDKGNFDFINDSGLVFKPLDGLTIGFWVMPNNADSGYLEHFISALINSTDSTYNHSQKIVTELLKEEWCNFSETSKQKAILHSYLAWQEKPGLPMGTAVQASYVNASSPNADKFQSWFENTFELEPDSK